MDVRMPDGTIIQNVPEGITQADLVARYEQSRSAPVSRGVGNVGMGSGARPDLMGKTGGILRGLRDPIDAGAQLLVRGANAVGLAPDSEVARVEGINKAAEQDYRDNWRGGNVPPIDLPRIAGAGAVGGAVAAPKALAPTLAGRIGQSARAGGIGGLLTPVQDAKDGQDFLMRKSGQVGLGAAGGAVFQPIGEGIASGVTKGAAWLANKGAAGVKAVSGQLTEDAARAYATNRLLSQGVDFNRLSREVQKSLVADVQEAMKRYGGVSGAALSRQADYDELGVAPLKAWVTRDPIDFGRTKNLEATDAGDALKQAKAALDAKLYERLGGLSPQNTGDNFQSGMKAGEALKRQHDAMREKVSSLYDAFAAKAPNVTADPQRFTNTVLNGLEKEMNQGFLNENLRKIVNDISGGKIPPTPQTLYQIQKLANAEIRGGGNGASAARVLTQAIDDELEQLGRDMAYVGPEMADAAKALKAARAAHRNLKMTEEAVPAFKAVGDGSYSAEDFLKRYIVGADVKEVASMWSHVGSDEVKSAARSQIVDALKSAAASDPTSPIKAQSFRKFIESPGMRQKLEIILGKDALEVVNRIDRAAFNASNIPSGARFNTSGSAMELVNLSSRIPFLGPMVGDPLKRLANDVGVAAMSKAGPQAFGKGLLDPMAEEILAAQRRAAGLLAPGVGSGVAFGVSN